MNPCSTRSFIFQLTIKNQKTKICYLILNWIPKTKKAVFFIISILDSDQKYVMEKLAAGPNLDLIFNLLGLQDLV